MVLADSKKVLGLIAVADELKEDSADAVAILKQMGITTYMITGDNKRTARAIAKKVGIENYFAEVLPEDKLTHVKTLQKKGKVAMVGDGINDAPALAQADIGIAMGSGTDVAMETGNIVLMKNSLLDVPRAITLSKMTMSKIRQNMFWYLVLQRLRYPCGCRRIISIYRLAVKPYDRRRRYGIKFSKRSYQCFTFKAEIFKTKEENNALKWGLGGRNNENSKS